MIIITFKENISLGILTTIYSVFSIIVVAYAKMMIDIEEDEEYAKAILDKVKEYWT